MGVAESESRRRRRSFRLALLWLFTAGLVAVYFALPDGEDANNLAPAAREAAEVSSEPRRLDILEVTPSDVTPGGAITISYSGAQTDSGVQVFAGKVAMEVLARRPGAMVARVPNGLDPGRIKLRAVEGGERSKPYDLRIKATNWRKPFRNLIGGFALLIFGIGVLARGAREAAGVGSAHAVARLAGRGPTALGFGALIGALGQSTTAAAGLLAGLVSSSLLAVGPAAIAFMGAGLGAATAPLVTGLIDPREGLMAVAVGVLWLNFAADRRSTAIARLILGAGLIAIGLQTLRPGFEPFVQDPTLIGLMSRLNTHGVINIGLCALLGTVLVAVLQGPGPVLVLVLVLAQTTAQWDLRTALAVLSGSGLGAAVGALLTTPAGARCRQWAILNLMLGLAATVFAAATTTVWSQLADWVVPGVPHEVTWGKRVLLPYLGLHLGVAFAFSQLATVTALLPVAPSVARWLDRRSSALGNRLSHVGDALGVARAQLAAALSVQTQALGPLSELVENGSRAAGRFAEHRLAEAHAIIEELLTGAALALPDNAAGSMLGRAAFTSLQLQRSLEALHQQAERLLDRRVTASSGRAGVAPLANEDAATLREMHRLLSDGMAALTAVLDAPDSLDLEVSRAREIHLNGLEARARGGLFGDTREPADVRQHLGVLELVDAYERTGNQVYRLTEALGESLFESSAVRVV